MRVDPNMVPDMLAAIQQSELSLQTALQQVSTGKSVNRAVRQPGCRGRHGAKHYRDGERRPIYAKRQQRASTRCKRPTLR